MKRNKTEKSFYHRLFILFIILILPVFFIKEYRLIKGKKDTKVLHAEDFCQTHLDPQEDKSFTFIVLTKNNVDSIEQNFQSIIQQHYSHFRVVYIDQGSTDGTVATLQSLIQDHPMTVIPCEKDYEVYQKYHEVVNRCKDQEVIIHLYGTDWLAHDDVLSYLNRSYANPDVWLTYGQYLEYSSYKKGIYDPQPKKVLSKKRIQRAPWVVAPFKTFYASLFKNVDLQRGHFLSVESDAALLVPIAELGKAHVRFIPDVLYIHNEKAPKEKRGHKLAFMGRKLAQSALLKKPLSLADLVIFSENQPEKLHSSLKSSTTHLCGIEQIDVIYDSTQENFAGYETLESQ
ncbi:MAG: glycosyltransferase family 2 protein, partial [Chlamydiia bacterium]|nr:glycosyltransferase family 2 protein [Chlamydiia bacterium]